MVLCLLSLAYDELQHHQATHATTTSDGFSPHYYGIGDRYEQLPMCTSVFSHHQSALPFPLLLSSTFEPPLRLSIGNQSVL
jgi:hypothetical protein